MRQSETTLTKPRPVREECRELFGTIRAERDRHKARPADVAMDCEHFAILGVSWGQCNATSLLSDVYLGHPCPQTCPCFRRRP